MERTWDSQITSLGAGKLDLIFLFGGGDPFTFYLQSEYNSIRWDSSKLGVYIDYHLSLNQVIT